MRKIFFIGALLCVGCNQSPEKKMQSEIKKYVDANFKDPSSYQQLEFKITDTVFVKEELDQNKEALKRYNANIDDLNSVIPKQEKLLKGWKELGYEYQYETEKAKKELDDYKSELITYSTLAEFTTKQIEKLSGVNLNNIYKIVAYNKYRAKNSYGGLDLAIANLEFNDSLRLVSFQEDKE